MMINIAIDGPSGGGKSTLAKNIAKKYGYIYVDTGALYRSIGLYMFDNGIDPKNKDAVISELSKITLEIDYKDGRQCVILNSKDVGERIRLPQISMYASAVSSIPEVRSFLLGTQKEIAAKNNVVMDGRDIGTVILPNAQVKIFLYASNENRARRRYDELCNKGVQTTYAAVLSDIIKRDENDKNRDVAPAVPAIDAVMLDNSGFEPQDTLNAAIKIIEEKLR